MVCNGVPQLFPQNSRINYSTEYLITYFSWILEPLCFITLCGTEEIEPEKENWQNLWCFSTCIEQFLILYKISDFYLRLLYRLEMNCEKNENLQYYNIILMKIVKKMKLYNTIYIVYWSHLQFILKSIILSMKNLSFLSNSLYSNYALFHKKYLERLERIYSDRWSDFDWSG